MVSDYRSRGVDYSDNDFALQGSINYTHETGFYVGGWASNIALPDDHGEIEVDLYGGYSGEIKGVTYKFGGILYSYPTGDHSTKTDFIDASGTIGTDFGFASGIVGVLYAFSKESIGNQDNIYVYSNLDVPVPETPITLKAHFGYEDGAFGDSKLDWLLGATIAYKSLYFSVSYLDTNKSLAILDSTVIFSVGKTF